MIEPVKCIGQIIDIGAYLVGRKLFIYIFHDTVEPGQLPHERLLALIFAFHDPGIRCLSPLLPVFLQDGLDPDDGIQDIGAGISLRGCKAVHIKDIILGRLVGQVAVFDGGQPHHLCDLLCLFFTHGTAFLYLLQHLFINVRQKVLKTHNAALPGLEGLAVLPVHGAEAKELQSGIFRHQPTFPGTAEHLYKMHLLPLVHHIDDPVRMIQLHPLYDGRQIRGRIERSPVRLQNHTRGHLLGIRFFPDIHHQSAVAHMGIPFIPHLLHHIRDIGLYVRLPFPQVKIHVQIGIISLQIRY